MPPRPHSEPGVSPDPVAYLATHGGTCAVFRARLLPRACSLRQQAAPLGCVGCPAPLAPAATEKPFITHRRHLAPTSKGPTMAPKGTCRTCGRGPITLPAKGLCSVCYAVAARADSANPDRDTMQPPAATPEPPETAPAAPGVAPAAAAIRAECAFLADFLVAKNAAYGNSALAPLRLFSHADRTEQLRVRIDDKLSRLAAGDGYPGEDTVLDLLGYLVLLRVATRTPAAVACPS